MPSIYKINKGINKPIEFRGLKAQYILYLAIGLVALLLLFAMLYLMGINVIFCLIITISLCVTLFITVYRLSDRYGQHGLVKVLAKRNIPEYIKVKTRFIFLHLKKSSPASASACPNRAGRSTIQHEPAH